MAVSRFFMQSNDEGVHWAKITERPWVLTASDWRRMNNPTLWDFCLSMTGKADIERSKSNVPMNAWLPPLADHFSDLKDR